MRPLEWMRSRVHLPRHRLLRPVPMCRCPFVVDPDHPHLADCPTSIDQRRRMRAGQGGRRDV